MPSLNLLTIKPAVLKAKEIATKKLPTYSWERHIQELLKIFESQNLTHD